MALPFTVMVIVNGVALEIPRVTVGSDVGAVESTLHAATQNAKSRYAATRRPVLKDSITVCLTAPSLRHC
jgi:hypothetical protein